ncbi:hypothetical protein LX32DRAFT_163060 [Colletotrichum zoysiae]|uniref:Siderophore biosynthesis enzyme n=1 Tax=Colletotrichum zoysiae TaxID=1216348 RepID=A0AAD9H6Q7_9PEZI|nr:hypothetical protein LX32DRAFT_163060 [Colletotrichum zoysiae]
MSYRLVASVAVLATAVLAKTDIAGCVSSDSIYTPTQGGTPYATRVWYVPGTGEICAALDCGGGRAPPKTDVPGCDAYKGTETYSPSFLHLETSAAAVAEITQPPVITPAPGYGGYGGDAVPTVLDSAAASEIKPSETQPSEVKPIETDLVESDCSADAVTSAPPAVTDVVSPGMNVTASSLITTPRLPAAQQTHVVGNGSVPTSAIARPTAAAPVGASRELFGLVAGMAVVAALL